MFMRNCGLRGCIAYSEPDSTEVAEDIIRHHLCSLSVARAREILHKCEQAINRAPLSLDNNGKCVLNCRKGLTGDSPPPRD